ncbi:type VI secretion system tip protein VgrG [Roseomonas terrae]|uniref:Type VI secretion system tip protein VgrG n=1 Tax=Neoroseomonas terrae TaxID=424799 RepID=A0ABS5EH11_9PROT|nr:type VI secretion system tip protein TssI/VgrG [Neoroseomonas terrae]MBR0650321.1 type VI secretion system tip protein VgrG [Neoroseomonas terrae]
MSVELSQESRLLRINTSVDKGFILRRVEAVEAISRPYVVQVEVLSLDAAVTAADMIGQTATVTIARDDTSPPRHFNGIINSFRKIGKFGTSYTTYGLEIVPSFWNLTRTSDARVFQNESVPTIVKKLCGEAGAAEPTFMSAPDTTRPYCMQFNESDFDFCQRLMDEIGCGYYFVHSETEHRMLVASASADYQTNSEGPYKATASAAAWDSLTGFSHRTRLRPGAVQALDYDLQKHSNPLDSTTPTALTQVANNASFKMFHWPGGQHVRPDGSPSLLEMQTYESEADVAQATGYDPDLIAGSKINIQLDANADAKTTWLLTRVVHSAFDETHIVDGGGSGYSCSVTMMPDDRPFRPASPRPRPHVPGLQSAIVVGPQGEEIHTDKLGRVKIRFLWDHHWPNNQTACEIWVRVAQPFAGKWGGTFFLPRIGDEVLVGFVDGDPDKPVIVGSLYSDDAPPPFPMPGKKEQGGFSTRSSKKGGTSNANILRFDDTKGSEEFYIQAEKDMNVLVKDNRTETIRDGNDTLTVKTGYKHVIIEKGDYNEWIQKGHRNIVVQTGNLGVFVEKGSYNTVVNKGDMSTWVEEGNSALYVKKGDQDVVVDTGNQSATVNKDITHVSKIGNIAVEAKAGKITLKAAQAIDLICGGSSIKMTPFQIELKSMMIKNDAQMSFEAKAGLMSKVEGMMTNVEASAMTTVKGGLVLIN